MGLRKTLDDRGNGLQEDQVPLLGAKIGDQADQRCLRAPTPSAAGGLAIAVRLELVEINPVANDANRSWGYALIEQAIPRRLRVRHHAVGLKEDPANHPALARRVYGPGVAAAGDQQRNSRQASERTGKYRGEVIE